MIARVRRVIVRSGVGLALLLPLAAAGCTPDKPQEPPPTVTASPSAAPPWEPGRYGKYGLVEGACERLDWTGVEPLGNPLGDPDSVFVPMPTVARIEEQGQLGTLWCTRTVPNVPDGTAQLYAWPRPVGKYAEGSYESILTTPLPEDTVVENLGSWRKSRLYIREEGDLTLITFFGLDDNMRLDFFMRTKTANITALGKPEEVIPPVVVGITGQLQMILAGG